MKVYSDKFLQALPKDQRKAMGKAGKTKAECEEKQEIKSERELQMHMRNLLNQRCLMFYTPSMAKRSPMPLGWPDFTILLPDNKVLFVEAKTPSGKCSKDQLDWHFAYFTITGGTVHVVRTLTEFKELLDRIFNS